MYDLHSVPSVDLRGLIELAKTASSQPSAALVESLIQAKVLDIETGRTLNPWERSRGYKRLMKYKRGDAYELPEAAGESFPLKAPANCR
jgi:hypothetical protein